MQEVIYYTFKKNYAWLVLNLLGLGLILGCVWSRPSFMVWWQVQVLFILFTISLFLWIYKYMVKHPMAVIDDETIKIDHTRPLRWKDIDFAEERIVNCCCMKKKVIVLQPKADLNYSYNYLQRHNGEFTPFSVPLYGILSAEDEEKIMNIIARKVGLKRL